MSLNCEVCTKTNNHCCKADIPLEIPIALSLIDISGRTDLSITEHPKFKERALIVKNEWEHKTVNVNEENCVFFIDSKCSIYENRPDICRLYGTKQMRCRWEYVEPEKICKATKEDIAYYDKVAIENSSIYKNRR